MIDEAGAPAQGRCRDHHDAPMDRPNDRRRPARTESTMTALDSGAGQLVDLVYVRNRCARPCCLGEQIKRHIVIVADRRKGQIRIAARVGNGTDCPNSTWRYYRWPYHCVTGDRLFCVE